MSHIKIDKQLHFPISQPGERTQCVAVNYASKDRNVIIETVSIGGFMNADGTGVIRRSEDNGRTWEIVEELNTQEQIEDDLIAVKSLPIVVYCDPKNGKVIRLHSTMLEKPSVYAWIYAEHPLWRTIRPHVQISDDEGKTWMDPKPVIVSREPFDETHWMPGVWQGKNGGMLCAAGHAIAGRDGQIIFSCDSIRLFPNGDICDPDADPATSSPDGPVLWEGSCLHARWNGAGGLDWSAGEKVVLPRAYSCDGTEEPSLAYLPDGRLFMAIRARTFPNTEQTLPSLHYYAISHDDGLTWESPRPLLYDDDSFAYSPACFITPFRSTKNGRLYVITNFADRPCVNCDPRNRLFIVEVDMETFRLRKDSMTVIDQRDEADNIRYSNWRYYEDRETGDVALFMNPACPETVKLGDDAVPQIYRYDIQLPG